MGKPQKKQQQPQGRSELSSTDRLGLRVSAMINSPVAQQNRSAVIHRLDTDDDLAWESVMEVLAETDGVELEFKDDGSVMVSWEKPSDADLEIVEEEAFGEIAEPESH